MKFENSDPSKSLLMPAPEKLEHLPLDPSYAKQIKVGTSRAEKLFKKRSSLRKAVLLKEIIHRPHDF